MQVDVLRELKSWRLLPGDHPGESAYNRLAHYQLDRALASAAASVAHGRLLDIGCGRKPYATLFAPYVTEHVGVDHPGTLHGLHAVDIEATAADIPVEDKTFGTVLLTEVIEHLEDPRAALAEAYRLLEPDGALILTTPFFWPTHEEPRDFFRYSAYGLRELAESAGFEKVRVEPLSGQWGTIALLSSYALRESPAKRLGGMLDRVALAGQQLGLVLDRRWPRPWMSWNHLLIARRPSS